MVWLLNDNGLHHERVKNQYCYVSLFLFCLTKWSGCLILHKSFLTAIHSMISFCIHSLLPMLLLLFDIWLLPEQQEDGEAFITNEMLLTVTCSWFCTRLLEFSVMSLCKNSFSSFPNARLPSSIPKKNRHNPEAATGRCSVKKVFLCATSPRYMDIGWLVLHKKVILKGDCFFPMLFYRR